MQPNESQDAGAPSQEDDPSSQGAAPATSPSSAPESTTPWLTAEQVRARLGAGLWTVPASVMRGPAAKPPEPKAEEPSE